MNALVSVVIPVYNCERYVAEAVTSALEQDYPHKEILVVDDGSTDGSPEVLRRFGNAIRVLSLANGGPARARNAGLRAARGEYIAFLDADDVWLQGKLSRQVEHLEAHQDVATCYTGWHVWEPKPDGSFERPAFAQHALTSAAADSDRSGWIYGRLLFDCELLTTTVMVRMSVAREIGEFRTDLPVGEDYDYWLRLSRAAKIARLDSVGALYRILPGSASRTARPVNFECDVVRSAIDRYGLSSPDGTAVDSVALQRRLDQLVFQHGYLHLHHGDPHIALEAFAEGLRQDPWQPRLWMHSLHALCRTMTRRRGAASTSHSL